MERIWGLGALSNRHFDQILVPIGTRHDDYLRRYIDAGFGCLELAHLYHDPEPGDRIQGWLADDVAKAAGLIHPAKLWKAAVAPAVEETGISKNIRSSGPKAWDDDALERAREAWRAMAPVLESGRMGPVVAQFPPSFEATPDHLEWLGELLSIAPDGSFAVELRNDSWWTPAVRTMLEDSKTTLVWGTHPKAVAPDWITSDTGYVRFTGKHVPSVGSRGRAVAKEDRLETIMMMRERLSAEPWKRSFVVVTNPFEGNAIDSLPRVAAALGDVEKAKKWTREPGRPLLDEAHLMDARG